MIVIPRALQSVCSNYIVDCFVEYVRKHDYPTFNETTLLFEERGDTALCTELDIEEHIFTAQSMEMGCTEGTEFIERFDGGVYLVEGDCFYILFDDHMYYFDF